MQAVAPVPSSSRAPRWGRVADAALVAGVFVLAFAVRWVAVDGLGGDDHWSLWNAATFLKGAVPFREFVDMGNPLHWFMSAMAQWLVGYRVVGEMLLGVTLSSWAITLGYAMARQSGGSRLMALGLAILALILVTVAKLYSYPKIFVYPLGLWLSWRYIDRPSLRCAIWLAVGVAVAFGYRHDHGAYVGLAAAAAVLAAHWDAGLAAIWRPMGRFALAGTLLLAPYFAWIQVNEGIVSYFRERIAFARQLDEAGRRAVPWVIDQAAPAFWLGLVPSPPARVAVAWAPDVGDATRLALEQRYGLAGGAAAASAWRGYLITDASESNLRALMSDPRVGLTDGITGSFRRIYGPEDPAAERPRVKIGWAPDVTAAERAAAERRYGLAPVGGPGDSGAFTYVLEDTASATLTALATDRRAANIRGLRPLIDPVVVRLREPAVAGPRIGIRWKPGMPDTERRSREARYALVNGHADEPGGRTWRYELANDSEDNVSALATDPRVEDTGGVAPASAPGRFVVREHRPAGGHILLRWVDEVDEAARAVLEARYHLQTAAASTSMREYTLRDASRDTIRALVSDPHALATSGLDRIRFTPAGEPRLTTLGREHAWLRVRLLPRLVHEENAGVFLYYVVYGLPLLVFGWLALDAWLGGPPPTMPHEARKMFVTAVMAAAISLALLRKLGYFPDHVDIAIVLGAWALRRAWRGHGALCRLRRVAVTALTTVVFLSAWSYINAPTLLARTGFASGLADGLETTMTRARALATSPPIDYYAPEDSIGDRAVIRYLYACTKPDDRIWLTTDVYTIPYYTERRVVGHIFWGMGFMASPEAQRKTIALLEREPVPFIFSVGGARPLQFLEAYDQVHAYVSQRYTETHAILQDQLDRTGRVLWLAVDSRRTPTGTYASMGLPCFR